MKDKLTIAKATGDMHTKRKGKRHVHLIECSIKVTLYIF